MVSGIVEKGITVLVAATSIAVIVITIITMVRSSKLIKKNKSFSAIAKAALAEQPQGTSTSE